MRNYVKVSPGVHRDFGKKEKNRTLYVISKDPNEPNKKIIERVDDPLIDMWVEDPEGDWSYILDKNRKFRHVYASKEIFRIPEEKRGEKRAEFKKSSMTIMDLYMSYVSKKSGEHVLDARGKGVKNVQGLVRPEFSYIHKEFSELDPHFKPVTAFVDIETGFDGAKLLPDGRLADSDKKDFPNIEKGDFPILTITVIIDDGNAAIFGLREYKGRKHADVYVKCRDEKELLTRYFEFLKENAVDVLTGWNAKNFDWPAIYNRAKKLGVPARIFFSNPEEMYAFDYVKAVDFKSREIEYYVPKEYVHLDFMEIYKIMSGEMKDSYSLDFIAEEELGENKISYDYDIFTFYNRDFEGFVDYNYQDVLLMVQLENKLKYHSDLYADAYEIGVNYPDALSTITPWTIHIWKKAYERKIVLPSSLAKETEKDFGYKGGFTHCNRPGLYEGVVVYDFSSLYPSIQMTFNVSIETWISPEKIEKEYPELLSIKERYTRGEDETYFLNVYLNDPSVAAEIREILERNGVTMTPNGEFFRIDEQGIMPELLSEVMEERKIYKNAMLRLEDAVERLRKEGIVPSTKNLKIDGNEEEFFLSAKTEEIVEWVKETPSEKELRVSKVELAMEIFDSVQKRKKRRANSEYGYMGNKYAPLSNKNLAASITATGRFLVNFVRKKVDEYFVKKYGRGIYIYADTDSNYYEIGWLIEKRTGKKYGELTYEEIIEEAERIGDEEIRPIIERELENVARNLNAFANKLNMKHEGVIHRALYYMKKTYAYDIVKSEGTFYEEGKSVIKGLAAKKKEYSPYIREKLARMTMSCVKDGYGEFFRKWMEVFEDFERVQVKEISRITTVNFKTEKSDYSAIRDLHDAKGVPMQVKAAFVFNEFVIPKMDELGEEFEKYKVPITQGSKVRMVKVSGLTLIGKNGVPFEPNAIAYPNVPTFEDFMERTGYSKYVEKTGLFNEYVFKNLQKLFALRRATIEEMYEEYSRAGAETLFVSAAFREISRYLSSECTPSLFAEAHHLDFLLKSAKSFGFDAGAMKEILKGIYKSERIPWIAPDYEDYVLWKRENRIGGGDSIRFSIAESDGYLAV